MKIILVIALTTVVVSYTSTATEGADATTSGTIEGRHGVLSGFLDALSRLFAKLKGLFKGKGASQGSTVSPQGPAVSPQGSTVSPQSAKEPTQKVIGAPQGTKGAPQGSTESPQGSTVFPQRAKEAPQRVTGAPQGTKWAPQGSTSSPQNTKEATQGTEGGTQDAKGFCNPEGIPVDACSLPIPSLVLLSQEIVDGFDCGKRINAEDFSREPQVKWENADKKDLYTFMLISCAEYFRWGVVNIPGSILKTTGRISNYTKLMEYQHLTVYPFNGEVKDCYYKGLLYRQTRKIPDNVIIEDDKRLPFDAKEFAQKHSLCGPLAGVQAWVRAESLD